MSEPSVNKGTVFTKQGMVDTNTGTVFSYGKNSSIQDRINRATGVVRASNRAAFNEKNGLVNERKKSLESAFAPEINSNRQESYDERQARQARIIEEAKKAVPPKDYKPTNYEFQGAPVYMDKDKNYRLATRHMIFRADLERKKK